MEEEAWPVQHAEASGGQMQATFIPMPETKARLTRYNFVTKTEERLNSGVPKFRGPNEDN